jgi:hypothetical protein
MKSQMTRKLRIWKRRVGGILIPTGEYSRSEVWDEGEVVLGLPDLQAGPKKNLSWSARIFGAYRKRFGVILDV